MKKVVYLSGGVGGAKFAKGLSKLKNIDLSIIVNTGDDEYIHGVALSPDIDSVIYGLANTEGKHGWGVLNDKFNVNNELKKFYDLNFMIGDKDLALNLFRNQMLNDGLKLTEITNMIKNKFNIRCNILPMSDDKVSTKLITKNGDKLNFQNYFVERKAKPRLSKVVYEGSRNARVSNQVLKLINQSDVLIVGPSNPVLSIGPILSISRLNQSIKDHNNVIAISPFVGKKALKGPSVQNFIDMGYKPHIVEGEMNWISPNNVQISESALVKNSVILDNCIIEDNVTILDSIISSNSIITTGTIISNEIIRKI